MDRHADTLSALRRLADAVAPLADAAGPSELRAALDAARDRLARYRTPLETVGRRGAAIILDVTHEQVMELAESGELTQWPEALPPPFERFRRADVESLRDRMRATGG